MPRTIRGPVWPTSSGRYGNASVMRSFPTFLTQLAMMPDSTSKIRSPTIPRFDGIVTRAFSRTSCESP